MSFIEVRNLCKDYKIKIVEPGLAGAFKSLFRGKYKVKEAVKNIDFNIEEGEIVGYIGPNGAGKSTTLKMLSGILIPSSGEAAVNGIIPYKNRKENSRHIGVVFGQRSQLYWDLPVSDTFELYENLYDIPKETFQKNKKFYIDLFDMGDFINQPVRQLSLGQKMKANIAIALMHDPYVLYLDEPTIGLDVTSKKILRESIKLINKEKNTTIMLTTHDMDDIEAVCHRLIMIDKGQKLFDGTLEAFRSKFEDGFILKLEFENSTPDWVEAEGFSLVEHDPHIWIIKVNGHSTRNAMIEMIRKYDPTNIYVQEQRIDDIVRSAFVNT